ncbi:MAG: cytochrome c [Terrimicrobiaceae bacterium]
MLKYFFIIFGFLVLVVIAMAGFRGHKSGQPPIEIFPDMDHQPKVKAQTPSNFFADRRAARPPVEGTVPIGYAMPMHKLVDGSVGQATGPYKQIYFSSSPTYFDTGKMGENWGTGIPYEVSPAVMQRGQQRYGIYCSVCHGATGAGNGMAQKFGLNTVQSLLQDRIRVMSDGEIFNTVTHGKNTMMAYGDRVQVIDRWAIVAYLRALQKSQGGATVADVPPEERAQLESKKQ